MNKIYSKKDLETIKANNSGDSFFYTLSTGIVMALGIILILFLLG